MHVMKKVTILLCLGLLLGLIFAGCGRQNSGGKSVDIPPYAIDNGGYFDDKVGKDEISLHGKATSCTDFQKYTTMAGQRETMPYSYLVTMDGHTFRFIYGGSDASKLQKPEIYSVHLIVGKAAEGNPYVATGESFCHTYYIYQDEQFEKARQYMEALAKTDNLPSSFKVGDYENGKKTYNAKIGATVQYTGSRDVSNTGFFALYLDCGAVVRLLKKRGDDLSGKTIDCVVDSENTIIDYKID